MTAPGDSSIDASPSQVYFATEGAGQESSRTDSWWQRARRRLPGGVNSPVRSFASVGGEPFVVASGRGSRLTTTDGRQLIDYVQSYGASILGHADADVVAAIARAAEAGTSFGTPTPGEVELAEEMVARVPGLEMVRMVSSGTEAVMSAIRLARAATGRDRLVTFSGCYHGHSDAVLATGGSGVATLGLAGSVGVPAGAVAETLVVPYNALPELDERVAAVLVEPVAANMGLVPPAPGFLSGLRRACDSVGALLIFDEVITGFRLAYGGAAEMFGVTPDLFCFGKVIGGGLPLAAFGGRRSMMELLAPTGPVYQAGTLSGNPVATAAGRTVLSKLTRPSYEELTQVATDLARVLIGGLTDAGFDVHVPRVGPLVGLYFGRQPVENYEQARKSVGLGLYPGFFHALLTRGVFIAPGPYESLFPSLAHRPADLEETAEAVASAAAWLAASSRSR